MVLRRRRTPETTGPAAPSAIVPVSETVPVPARAPAAPDEAAIGGSDDGSGDGDGDRMLRVPQAVSASPAVATTAHATGSSGTPPTVEPTTATGPETETGDPAGDSSAIGAGARATRRRLSPADATSWCLVQAAHPAQAVLSAAGVALAAGISDRPAREVALVALSVLVGQSILGWHNDLVDADLDAAHLFATADPEPVTDPTTSTGTSTGTSTDTATDTATGTAAAIAAPASERRVRTKPIAAGRLDRGTTWFAVTVAALVLIPLSLSVGVTAGLYYLGSVVVGLLANVALRRGRFSFLPWAVSFALLVPYLSYGGWGGGFRGEPPSVPMIVLAALLGVGVHFLRAIWGLVADDQDGWTYLPLVLGRKVGATRLLAFSVTWCAVMVAALLAVGATVGLRA